MGDDGESGDTADGSAAVRAIRRWSSPLGQFVRFLTPNNSLLTIVVAAAAYLATRPDVQWWWMALLLLASFVVSLVMNWTREVVFGAYDSRLAHKIAERLGSPLSDTVRTDLGEHRTKVQATLDRVEAVIGKTAHGDLAASLGLEGIARPDTAGSNSLEHCLENTNPRQQLWILGLQANKWINYGGGDGVSLRNLLEVGIARSGQKVRFLLLDPNGEQIARLRGSEGENIAKQDAIQKLEDLADEFPDELEVRYYDEKPQFRMVFCDGVLILSCYALSAQGQFLTRRGADAPHLVVREQKGEGMWPLYDAFADYYADFWERSQRRPSPGAEPAPAPPPDEVA
ncbi:MAG: hypothetical protein AAGA65_10415 [Actinomycetota bacterium]